MANRNWVDEFTSDLDMMGRIIGDVLKLQKAEDNPHRRGRRTVPQISRDELWLLFEGFSTEEFVVALERLTSGKSIRQVANKCKMNHMVLYRLLKGETKPTLESMEQIAQAFNKSPYYFREYRAEVIALAVKKELLDHPNRSIKLFRDTLGGGRR
jgi:hypothetical protein